MNFDRLKYYRARILQELSLRTGLSLGRPTGCIVLLTNRCNARCVHCLSWKVSPIVDELSTQEWMKLFSQLREWLGPVYFSITGGETLLKKDAVHLTKFAASKGFWTEFLTNGYLMNKETASNLVQSGVKRIKVSMDGSSADIHDLIRGRKGFFDRATEALCILVEEKTRLKKDVALWAKTSIMSHNIRDLATIAIKTQELGLNGVEYQALEPVYYSQMLLDKKWYRDNPLWVRDSREVDRSIEELKKLKSEGLPIVNSIENLEMIRNYFHDPEGLAHRVHSHEYSKKKPKKPQCTSWVGGLQIMPDGGLKMCHFMEPFACSRDGNIKTLWLDRNKCWTKDCRYIEHQ